jgi:endonuclease G
MIDDSTFPDHQWGAKLYSADKSDSQRGHMTKREDPQWGDTEAEALAAAQATFHFSNCVPQLGGLNTKKWGKLETYILNKESVPEKLKVSVLKGPILSPHDQLFVTPVIYCGNQNPYATVVKKVVFLYN